MRKIFILLFFCVSIIFAQQDLINLSYRQNNAMKLYLSAYKENYVLDSPVIVKLSIKNTGLEEEEIISYPENFLSYQFYIFDENRNLILKNIPFQNFRTNLLKKDIISPRKIVLYPDEEFSSSIDLNKWFNFTNIGRYIIQAAFVSKDTKIYSNPIKIMLNPNKRVITHLRMEKVLREREAKRTFTPQGTIEFILNAEKNKDWESFFKYIDLDKIILLYNPFAKLYKNTLSKKEKEKIIDDFKNWYKTQPEANNLEAYKLQNIVFPDDPNERIVYSYVRYSEKIIPNNYLYKYHLYRKGNKWYLDNIESFVAKNRNWEHFDFTAIEISKNKQ